MAETSHQGLVGQPLLEGLGDTEVDHLGDRLSIAESYKDIGRFQIAVDNSFLMGMLNGGTQQTVLVLLRALDLKWPTVSALMAYRAKKQRTRETLGPGAQRDYEAIDLTAAKRTLRFLQVRSRVESETNDDGFTPPAPFAETSRPRP